MFLEQRILVLKYIFVRDSSGFKKVFPAEWSTFYGEICALFPFGLYTLALKYIMRPIIVTVKVG